jgi:hypothetical protein
VRSARPARPCCCFAKEQGEDLIRLKDQTPHGEFKARVERETTIRSYDRAVRYKRVAELMATVKFGEHPKFDWSMGIDAFLDLFAEEQPAKRKARPSITREDAEYALKIHALAERGATEGERDAAAGRGSAEVARGC